MNVKLLDYMGSDDAVVDAARVSFSKAASLYTKEQNDKLIKYLAEHNHWSPFAHCMMKFRIKAPIFVARQLVKHQVGLAWNEVSARYVTTDKEFYYPKVWRKQSKDKKQGSTNDTISLIDWNFDSDLKVWGGVSIKKEYEEFCEQALRFYKVLIGNGVSGEQARMVLPISVMTEWIWTGSLYAFARVCNLRLKPDAQEETREIAKLISDNAKEHFPVSWSVLVGQ